VRGFVHVDAKSALRVNCAWVPIGASHALALVGLPPELPAPRHTSTLPAWDGAWVEERTGPVPYLHDATLTQIRRLLEVRMGAMLRDDPPPGGEGARSFENVVALLKRHKKTEAGSRIAQQLMDWLSRAKATFEPAELRDWLGVEERTFQRNIRMLGE